MHSLTGSHILGRVDSSLETAGQKLCVQTNRLNKLHIYLTNKSSLLIKSTKNAIQSNLDYPDSLGLHEIVRIIEGPDTREYEY